MSFHPTSWRVSRWGSLALAVSAVAAFAGCQSEQMQEGLGPQSQEVAGADTTLKAAAAISYQALAVIPQTTTLTPGQTLTFQALNYQAGVGRPFPYPVAWSATGGTITSSGVYTAGQTPGTFSVRARGTTTPYDDQATVVISSSGTTTIRQVVLTPAIVSLAIGASQQFSASASLSDGSTQANPAVTWAATGGTVSSGGLYKAGSTAGSFRVIATSGNGKADTSAVTVTTTAPPPSGGNGTTLFSSDWASGDLLDGGKWRRWGGQGILSIVSASGMGFPSTMARVMRVAMGTGSFDWVEADGKWSLPAVGQSRAFRLYIRNAVGNVDGGWSATHPVESKGTDGSIAGNFYAWHLGSNADGTFPIALAVSAPYPRNYWTISNATNTTVGTLKKQSTYRLEWKFTRTGGNQYSLDMRVYGADDRTLVADRNSIKAWGGGALASNAGGITVDDAFMTGIRIGLNGGFSASGLNYVYYGGFAACSDWCGAY